MRCLLASPIYRDTESFLILRERVSEVLGTARCSFDSVEFLVIDDAAGEDPDIALLGECDDVTVLTPPFNLGHQRVMVAGLRSVADRLADNDIVVTLDGDGEDRPEDIPRLIAALEAKTESGTAVVARRTHRDVSLRFRLLYLVFRAVYRILTGTTVRSGNFAAYRGSYVRSMLFHPTFDLCYSSSLVVASPNLVYVPCARGARYAGKSKMDTPKLIAHGIRMLMPLADRIAIRSLVLSAMMVGGTLIASALLVVTSARGTAISPWFGLALLVGVLAAGLALLVFVVLFSGFVQAASISLGRIGEQVVDDERRT